MRSCSLAPDVWHFETIAETLALCRNANFNPHLPPPPVRTSTDEFIDSSASSARANCDADAAAWSVLSFKCQLKVTFGDRVNIDYP